MGVGGFTGAPAAAAAAPIFASALPSLSAPSLALPALAPALAAPIPAALDAARPAAAPASLAPASPAAAPALEATENGLIRTHDVAAGLAALRAASYELHPQVAEIVARIRAARPELPISAENLFLVRDAGLLNLLGIPEEAAGAARILSDGRSKVPVVILVAVRGVELDDFVEFGVHKAVHLMDDGILRVRHDE